MDSRDRRSRDLRRSFSSTRDRSLSRGRRRGGSTSTSPDPRDRTRAYSLADSSSSRSSSRSRSRGHGDSRRRRRRQQQRSGSSSRRRTPPPARKPKSRAASPKPTALETLKSSAPLLATIGVASVLAHKLWPKGVLFGDKEEWETRKVVSRTVERGEDGRIRRERHVRKEDGEIVVDDFMRRNRRRDEEMRREGSLDGAGHRPRALDRRRLDALEPAPPPRRPLSMYEEDRPPRRYDTPPHDRRLAPAYPDERYAPRASDRYGYEDPGYYDRDRDRRPGRAYDDRTVYDDRYYER